MTTPQNPFQPEGGPVQDADEWLMGGGVKSFSFNGSPPITATGTVAEQPSMLQKRDFEDGTPLSWADGSPRMMMKVVVATDQRLDQEDDGKRALYLENRKAFAVRDAVRTAGASKLEVGGTLSLTYTSDDLAAKKGNLAAPKNFTATYTAPDPLAQVVPPQQGNPWDVSVPLPAPVPVPAQGIDPGLVAWLGTKGIDTSKIDEATARAIGKTYPDYPFNS